MTRLDHDRYSVAPPQQPTSYEAVHALASEGIAKAKHA